MTRQLALRAEQPPDDATVVVRAGVMSAESIRNTAERTFSLYAIYGLSVEGVLDGNVQDACRGDRISSYRRVRLSSFGRLRASGFALLATFDRPYFSLVLADLSELTVTRLAKSFDDPIPNPGRPSPG